MGVNDLDDIVTSCVQHAATGYILVCSTQPSSAVVDRLEGVTNNKRNEVDAIYWDGVMIERLLSQPRQWAIAQRFMPLSCGDWKIYATEAPNDFVAHYKGYVFHLSNRIGSRVGHHLPSISARISDIENIILPEGHFIRPRAVWYDDKNGGYTWYIDYMRPHDHMAQVNLGFLLNELKDGWALEDGQCYNWDIKFVKYSPFSDHYDRDHYDYYTKYLPNYLSGSSRKEGRNFEEYWETKQAIQDFENNLKSLAHESFSSMVDSFKKLPYLNVIRAVNANFEALIKFERRYNWLDLIQEFDVSTDNIFTATLIFDVIDIDLFMKFLAKLPIGVDHYFRAKRVYIFLPEKGFDEGAEENIFDVHFMVHPALMCNQKSAREEFNKYFGEIKNVIEGEIN